MAEPLSFSNIVVSTAKQKLAAARGRQSPDTTAEKPREAILDGLKIVDETISEDGYLFSPSGPKFVRKHGDFTFQIIIQSDRNNVAGQRAAVWVHAAVYSRAFTAWSKKHSSGWIRPNAPFPLPVFATQLGYLSEPAGWMEWDFANTSRRTLIAEDLVACIRAGAYSLFSMFEAGADDIARLVDRDWLSLESILTYFLSTGDLILAGETLRSVLNQRHDLRGEFERLRQEFVEHGVPNYRTGGAHDLAAFAVATGYPWRA